MRVILRNRETGQYWAGEGKWTTQPGEAFDFREGTAAILFATQSHMAHMEMILSFENPIYDMRFRLGDGFYPPGGPG